MGPRATRLSRCAICPIQHGPDYTRVDESTMRSYAVGGSTHYGSHPTASGGRVSESESESLE